uniref:Uncharacterized protein TCIL3000_11_12440 n=1 Tax=Trypanosoma congolense (strain IL3000) TaxID=1068625 RepID=G0V276_TRYCI|nr:unnamed protein product [Trypanosoma congolense IL3000]
MLRRGLPRRGVRYHARMGDLRFLTEDVFDMCDHYKMLGHTNVSKDFLQGVLNDAGGLASKTLAPLYTIGNAVGCRILPNGEVRTPEGFRDAYKALCNGGWIGMSQPVGVGGKALPYSLGSLTHEVMATANFSLLMYAIQSLRVASVLTAAKSAKQHEDCIRRLVSGEWSGTISLAGELSGSNPSEELPATERAHDGTYRLTGKGNLVLAGDHDLAANVVHLVLARLPVSQSAETDVSLFLVPRHVVGSDGSLQAERNVKCLGLETPMGIKGCTLSRLGFDNAVGYFVATYSPEIKHAVSSLSASIVGLAMQGVCQAELAFQNALAGVPNDGSRGFSESSERPSGAGEVIIPDVNVRSNILCAKAIAEGGRAFSLSVSRLIDIYHQTTDAPVREALENEIDFYTVIAKTCLTRWAAHAAFRCLQICSRHDCLTGSGMEFILRDANTVALHGNVSGAHALGFLQKHILHVNAKEPARLGSKVCSIARAHFFSSGIIGQYARRLWLLQKQWKFAITKVRMIAVREPVDVSVVAEDVLMYAGYMVLAYHWLHMAIAAQKRIKAGEDTEGFYQCKLDLCQYVFQNVISHADAHFQVLQNSTGVIKVNESALSL